MHLWEKVFTMPNCRKVLPLIFHTITAMILVTGGTGLLGSHFLFELLKEGEKVRATCRSSSNLDEVKEIFRYYTDEADELLSHIQWIEADMLNYPEVFEALEGIEKVYHCAATVSFDPAHRAKMIRDNTLGTENIVNAALERGIKKLLHVSSSSAIGKAPDASLANEGMIWTESPSNTGYSISKFRSEMEVWRGIQEGLNAVIVNPTIVLGPGFWNKGSSKIFSRVDKGLKYYSNGITGYVSVWDTVKASIILMKSDINGERYILSSENLTYRNVFDMVAEALGKQKPTVEGTQFLTELAWRADWVKSKLLRLGKLTFSKENIRVSRSVARFDNAKIKNAIDFEFEPIQTVVDRIADYYTDKRYDRDL